MIELLVKWRYNVNFNNIEDWDGWNEHISTGWQIYDDEEGKKTLNHTGFGTSSLIKNILKKNTEYKLSYNLTDFYDGKNKLLSGGVKISVGSYSIHQTNRGQYDYYFNSNNNTDIRIDPFTYSSTFGINDIIIEEISNQKIDLLESNDIYLNYNFSDIKDLNNKGGAYSKEFNVPGTDNNNKFFNMMFNINSDSKFNIFTKVYASIRTESGTLMNGYIQLKSILNDNDKITYKIIFYSKVVDLFTDFGDMKISDLDFTDLNHVASYNNVRDTWTNNYDYVYPYIDYGLNKGSLDGMVGAALDDGGVGLSVGDLRPALRVKTIFDKIFSYFNKSYSSSFINSSDFYKLIIPFNRDTSDIYDWYKVAKIKADPSTTNNLGSSLCYDSVSLYYPSDWTTGKYKIQTPTKYIQCVNDGIPSSYPGWIYQTELDTYDRFNNNTNTSTSPLPQNRINYSYINYKVQTISSSPYYSIVPDYQFNRLIPGTYKVLRDGKYKLKIRYKISQWSGTGIVKLFGTRINEAGVDYIEDFQAVNTTAHAILTDSDEYCTYVSFDSGTHGFVEREVEMNCFKGDMIGFKFVVNNSSGNFIGYIDYIEVYEYGFGKDSVVDMNKAAPQNYLIKDFVSDILTMFNAVIVEHDNEYLIENIKDYYNNFGNAYDWSNKLDKEHKIEMNHPLEYQENRLLFKYDDASDYYNDWYNTNRDENGYGEYSTLFNNEFSEGEKEISLTLKPSILRSCKNSKTDNHKYGIDFTTYTSNDMTSDLIKYELNTNIGNRIVSFSFLEIFDNTLTDLRFRLDGNTLHGQATPMYPYAGHLSNPFHLDTTKDYNFDTAFYKNGKWMNMFVMENPTWVKPNINLYNLYWKEYIDEIRNKNAKIVTAFFNLNEIDINKFTYADKIYIDDVVYTINKIVDYNPLDNQLTKVELLKQINVSGSYDDYISYGDLIPSDPPEQPSNSFGTGVISVNGDSISIGNANILDSGVNINTKNTSTNNNSTIVDSNNINFSYTGNTSTIINEENITIKDEGVYINGVKIVDGVLLNSASINDCGKDKVQNDFTDAGLNDCGENQIYEIDRKKTYIIKDGGKD